MKRTRERPNSGKAANNFFKVLPFNAPQGVLHFSKTEYR